MGNATLRVVGTSPYVQSRFSEKAKNEMMATQEAGSHAKSRKKREPRDFDRSYRDAMHVSEEGWPGIPASSLRSAMIRACDLVGFKMTRAKCSIFIVADGIDKQDGTPLVKISGEPEKHTQVLKPPMGNANVVCRPMWRKWGALVRISWDMDQFSLSDVTNLLLRAGMQVGIGEGRASSRNCAGVGWGHFTVETNPL